MKFDDLDHKVISLNFEGALHRHVKNLNGGVLDLALILETLQAFENGKLGVTVLAPGIWAFEPVRGAEAFTQKRRNKKLFQIVMAGTKLRHGEMEATLSEEDKLHRAVGGKALGLINVLADGGERAFAEKVRADVALRDAKLKGPANERR